MVTIKFFGRILPTGIHIHTESPEVTWKWAEENINVILRVYIVDSKVTVECDLPIFKDDYVTEIHKWATDLSRACVNLAAFSSGIGLTTIIDEIQFPDGQRLPAHKRETIPPECNNAFSLDPAKAAEFNQVLNLVVSDVPVFLALDDLIRSISSAHTAASDCGRVLDRLRWIIAPTLDRPADRSAAWQEMHGALNISRDYQEWISQQATGNRHGRYAFIPASTIAEIIQRTFAIFNRFLEYRKRGNVPLTAPDFPELA